MRLLVTIPDDIADAIAHNRGPAFGRQHVPQIVDEALNNDFYLPVNALPDNRIDSRVAVEGVRNCGECEKRAADELKLGNAMLRISTTNKATLPSAGPTIAFAPYFEYNATGYRFAEGPYEVRANAAAVTVVKAEVTGEPALEELIAALRMAWAEHERMKGGPR